MQIEWISRNARQPSNNSSLRRPHSTVKIKMENPLDPICIVTNVTTDNGSSKLLLSRLIKFCFAVFPTIDFSIFGSYTQWYRRYRDNGSMKLSIYTLHCFLPNISVLLISKKKNCRLSKLSITWTGVEELTEIVGECYLKDIRQIKEDCFFDRILLYLLLSISSDRKNTYWVNGSMKIKPFKILHGRVFYKAVNVFTSLFLPNKSDKGRIIVFIRVLQKKLITSLDQYQVKSMSIWIIVHVQFIIN